MYKETPTDHTNTHKLCHKLSANCFFKCSTPVVQVRAIYGYGYGCCNGHIVRLKVKQDGGICSARWFRTSVRFGIDADCTGKRKL